VAKIDLNVASRPFINARPLERALLAAGIGLALLSFANGYRMFAALRAARVTSQGLRAMKAETELARSETRRLGNEFSDPERKRIRQVAASTNGMIRKRKLSWTRLLDQLERVLPRDVRILQISPEAQGRQMALLMDCLAKDNEAKLKLYGKLHEAPFSEAYILGESLERDRIRFSVRCRYDPGGADAVPLDEPASWERRAATPSRAALGAAAGGEER
jgi:type IV pilus assembly protein PilN